MKKRKIIAILIIAIATGILVFSLYTKKPKEPVVEESVSMEPSVQTPEPTPPAPEPETPQKPLASQWLLSVPFTPQAPTANWDELHNEACEEASLLMAVAFFQGDTRLTLPPSEVETEIKKLTAWQQKNFGYHLSINSQELAEMAKEVYGLKAEVLRTSITEHAVKQALSENKLVLAPVNGRLLGNPFFQTPGPIYHMFVIKGYDETGFITNDPGTKRGQDYRYSWETILNALGDYDHHSKETDPGKPALIILSK